MSTLLPTKDKRVQRAVKEAMRHDDDGLVAAMRKRGKEMGMEIPAMLAGIGVSPPTRRVFDDELNAMWKADSERPLPTKAGEVIVGGGLHAAIYAAMRVARGMEPPLILEEGTIGGAFAVSGSPSFFLNSRNRPGEISLPSEGGGLNVLPGAVLQPAHMSNAEYQRNSDLGFVIRATLAMTGASVYQGRGVKQISPYGNEMRVYMARGMINAQRVIVATGLGRPSMESVEVPGQRGKRVLDFTQFMGLFNKRFPLAGFGRVAVIGAGDSGRTVVEALTGQGPLGHLSTAAMDWPDTIDWYGTGASMTCQLWEANNRTRYKRLGRLFNPTSRGPARVKGMNVARRVGIGADCAYVDERRYDYVIVCVGFKPEGNLATGTPMNVGGRQVARSDAAKYIVGPAAALGITTLEEAATSAYSAAPENRTALFRYADRTAALAAFLPAVKPVPAPPKPKAPGSTRPKVTVVNGYEIRRQDNVWRLYADGKPVSGQPSYYYKRNAVNRAKIIKVEVKRASVAGTAGKYFLFKDGKRLEQERGYGDFYVAQGRADWINAGRPDGVKKYE